MRPNSSGSVFVGATNVGTVTGYGTANMLITFNTNATDALVEQLMQAIGFTTTSENPGTSRTATVTFNDGGHAGAGGPLADVETVTINITAVNDAPVNTVPATQVATEDTSKAITGLSIADVDAGSGSVTVTLTVTSGILNVAGGTAAIANSGTSTVTLTGTLGAINSTLASNVTFVPNANSSGAVTLTMTTNDNGSSGGAPLSDVDTVTINVGASNDAPTFSGLNATPGYTEGGAAVVLDSNALLADIELDAANNYAGATLTLARNGGASSQDVFGATGTLSFSAGNVILSAVTVGTFTNTGGTLVITFNGNATSARVDSVLQQLTYANNSDAPPASVQVNYTFSDGNAGAQGAGGALNATGSITVGIAAVNDAPVNTVPATQVATEDTSKAITGLSIADVDAGSGSVTVTLAVTNGTLTVAGGSAGIANSGTSTVTLTGTQAAINSTLASNVTFVPNANFSGAATLTMTTNDNGNSGGAPMSDVDTVTINISAVNDAPVTNPDSVITNVGTGAQVVIPTAWLLANDTDVETSPLTAVAGVGGATGGSVSGPASGNVTFTDDGTLDGTFTYQANDGSVSGAAATVTIDNSSTATTTLVGTAASEIFIGGATGDTIRGAGGNDFINGAGGTDLLDFSDGTNGITFTLTQSASDTVVNLSAAGLGTDTYRNMEGVIGTASADTINGSASADTIRGGGGTDTLAGAGGADTYVFGLTDGSDTISEVGAGSSGDTILIDANGAALTSLSGLDDNNSSDNGDLIIGFNGQQIRVDEFFDNDNNVVETISFDNATYKGYSLGSGTYTIGTDEGSTRDGTSGNDLIVAEAEGSVLDAGAGNDILLGNAGDDTLDGGANADLLVGGAGTDNFSFSAGDSQLSIGGSGTSGTISGYDVIADFTPGSGGDRIVFSGAAISAIAATNNSSLFLHTGFAITSNTIASGIAQFSDTNGNNGVALTSLADVAAAVQFLQANDMNGGSNSVGATVAFEATIGGINHTYVFIQGTGDGSTNNNDVLIDLVGVNASSITASSGSITVNGTSVADPLILDLGNHGISLAGIDHGVSFDINADGTPDQVAWTTGEDGILVLDVNGNGTIDSGAEMFSPYFAGGDYASSLASLASLDSNGDGVMDANDAEFANLTVWQDANHDGVSQANELASLGDHGITSIDLQATPANDTIDGQQVLSQGSFTTADGGTGTFVEVAFDTTVGGNENNAAAGAHTTVLTDAHATEFISDYSAARGDVIDVTGLLDANFGPDSNLSDFVNVIENGSDVTIQIDQNGPASGAHFVDVAVLQGYGTSASDIVRIAFENAEQQIAV